MTTSGGNAPVAAAGDAPGVEMPDATIDDSSPSTIEIAYNATGVISSDDVILHASGPNVSEGTAPLSNTKGTASITIDSAAFGGGSHEVTVDLINTSNGRPVASDTGIVTAASPVTLKSYSLSSSSVSMGENVTANVTLENTDSSAQNYTLTLYDVNPDGSKHVNKTRKVSVSGSSTEYFTFNRSYAHTGTRNLTINEQPVKTVSVTNPISVKNYGISKSTVAPGESLWINVTLENIGSADASYSVSIFDGATPVSRTKNVPASTTRKIAYKTSYASPGYKPISVYSTTESKDLFSDSVTVTNPVTFVNATVSKEPVGVNENVRVNATLHNPTGSALSYPISFTKFDRVNGQFVSDRTNENPSVAANSYETVSFTTSFSSPGEKFTFLDHGMQTLAEPKVFVAEDTSGTSSISVSDVKKPSRAVVDGRTMFVANLTNTGDAAGVYNLTLTTNGTTTAEKFMVGPNTNRFAFLTTTYGEKGTESATFGGDTFTVDVGDPVVVDSSIEHVNGPSPSKTPDIEAGLTSFGMINVGITDSKGGQDLSALNVDEDTTFRVNVSVENYDPRALVSSGTNLTWTRENVSGKDLTNVTAYVNPAQMDMTGTSATVDNWDSKVNASEPADFGMDAAIMMGISDGTHPFFDSKPSSLSGMTVSTDAQLFRPPVYEPPAPGSPPQLQIKLAAPHLTANGKVNQGYYRAFLPDALLDEWNVTSKSQLDVSYSADPSASFEVTEESGGMMVNLTHHYSAGTAIISADTMPPTVIVGSDKTATAGKSVNFDASGSTDDDAVDTYEWDFGDGSTGTGAAPSHTYDGAGTYTATVTVTDASGNVASESIVVTVESADDGSDDEQVSRDFTPDISVIDASLDRTTVESGSAVFVEATLENAGAGDGSFTAELVVDGTVVETVDVRVDGNERRTVSFLRTFDEAGSYELAVSDANAGGVIVEAQSTATATSAETTADTATATPSDATGEETATSESTRTDASTDGSGDTTEAGTTTAASSSTAVETTASDGQPGFGAAVAIVALLAVGLFARRRR